MKESSINYFAYGSNIDIGQMGERNVPWMSRNRAVLNNWGLVFNKRGVLYPDRAVANIEQRPGGIVEGVVYELSQEALSQMDNFEIGYRRELVPVTVFPEQATPYNTESVVYVAEPEFIASGLSVPNEYLLRIVTGGKGVFTPDYAERVRAAARRVQ